MAEKDLPVQVEGDDVADDDLDASSPYGISPARRLLAVIHRQPAWAAVGVELIFVLVVCNQWALDHIAVTGEQSGPSWGRQLVDELVDSFAWTWTPSPVGGYVLLWFSFIVRIVLWLGWTFLLLRWARRSRGGGAASMDVVGAVFLAAVLAAFAERVVGYPDAVRLARAETLDPSEVKFGFGQYVLAAGATSGAVLAVLIVAVVAAAAVSWFVLGAPPAITAGPDEGDSEDPEGSAGSAGPGQ